jgi:hypothetical protein
MQLVELYCGTLLKLQHEKFCKTYTRKIAYHKCNIIQLLEWLQVICILLGFGGKRLLDMWVASDLE